MSDDGSPSVPTLDTREKQLAIEKLQSENELLRRQLSGNYEFREWLKAVAPVVAVLGLLWTVWAGINQIKDARRAQEETLYRDAVTRLASKEPSERLAGILGLRPYLTKAYRNRHAATLSSLANALALENDPAIRGALVDLVSGIDPAVVGKGALNEALTTLVVLNRSLVGFSDKNPPSQATIADNDLLRIESIAKVAANLVRKGAHVTDMSGIYCFECNFAGDQVDLSGVTFDYSYLRRANFSHAKLDDSSFEGANLEGTKFIFSHLVRAKFTNKDRWDSYALIHYRGGGGFIAGPDFSCADLTKADFTGHVLFGVDRENGTLPDRINLLRATFQFADLDQTDLSNVRVYELVQVPSRLGIMEAENSARNAIAFHSEEGVDVHRLPSAPNAKTVMYMVLVPLGKDSEIDSIYKNREYEGSFYQFAEGFFGARHLETANIPKSLRDFLHENIPDAVLERDLTCSLSPSSK